jgi:hypothetical protein
MDQELKKPSQSSADVLLIGVDHKAKATALFVAQLIAGTVLTLEDAFGEWEANYRKAED